MNNTQFKKIVWDHYRKAGRSNLPWRKTTNVYHILVSEIMLQQTQVSRVVSKYTDWLRVYPDIKSLAQADFIEVLQYWQGLGYQRRAKYLQQIAVIILEKYNGKFPKNMSAEELDELPGIGPYTARAIKTFSSNSPEVFIETNIRTVYIHHFFNGTSDVNDKDILSKIEETLELDSPKEWYWALMDYGSYLKSTGIKNNHQSKTYAKQTKFTGSNRQVRGKILKFLLEVKSVSLKSVHKKISVDKDACKKAMQELEKEGFIVISNTTISMRSKLLL
jgi:A/G-specific adenine glycosylase